MAGVELVDGEPEHIGPYRIIRRLGSGGMGKVYQARSDTGRVVALKVISAATIDPGMRAAFAQEVEATSLASSPFTAKFVDADVNAPVPWLATEYVPGTSLRLLVQELGPLPIPHLLALGEALADGLRQIHGSGVVHRDLTPSNIILAPDRPRIIDFGFAALLHRLPPAWQGLTTGTPGFMSPEQASGGSADPQDDIYSWGAVLTWAATGRGPTGHERSTASHIAHRAVEPELVGVPQPVRLLLGLCLAPAAARPSAARLVTTTRALAERELGLGQDALDDLLHDIPASWDSLHQSRTQPQGEEHEEYEAPEAIGREIPASEAQGAGGGSYDFDGRLMRGAEEYAAPEADAQRDAAPESDGDGPWPNDSSYEDYWDSVAADPSPLLLGEAPSPREAAPPQPVESVPGGPAAPPGMPGSGLPTDEPPPGHYLTGELPERAPVDARISLLIRVTLGPAAVGSAGLKEFTVPPTGTTVTITVSAPGLLPFGDLEQDLLVPFAADSEPVRFGFRAGRAGLHPVVARAFCGGTFLGELALQVSVEVGTALEEGRWRSVSLAAMAAEPGEVTLQVSRTDDDRYTFQLIGEALYRVVLSERLAGDPTRVVGEMVAELRAMSANESKFASPELVRRRLRSLGARLWADVVPDAIRRQFWAQRDRISLFTIASDMDTVPWELLYPVDSQNEAGFLVEQFPVVRRVYGQGRARTLRLDEGVAYVVPPRSPANALDEVHAVSGIFPPGLPDRGVCASLDTVLELLDAAPSVLHFACHNAFSDTAGSVISLDGGPLRPSDLSYARQTHALAAVSPLVFLNGCRTAGEIAGFTEMTGWAREFMAAGAGAFVGSLWAVRSSSAKGFAEEFYRALVRDGAPLGAASLRARQAIAADEGDPTWLAYTVYGNPSATITAEAGVAREATGEGN